jgi:oligo-1,6-glucosidase
LDEATGEYYLHLFSRKQPDLNWENPQVRQAVYAMMRWWLDRGVDGFRMDVVNMLSKDPALPDGHVMPPSRYGDGFPHFICGPRIHEFLQEMHREVFASRDAELLTVGDMRGVTLAQALLYTDRPVPRHRVAQPLHRRTVRERRTPTCWPACAR